jgi:hypothetical protein
VCQSFGLPGAGRRADVLVYNNDWEGFAIDNARSLRRRFRNE